MDAYSEQWSTTSFVLMLLAVVRGSTDGLMAMVSEDHVGLHRLQNRLLLVTTDLDEELTDLVRGYLK